MEQKARYSKKPRAIETMKLLIKTLPIIGAIFMFGFLTACSTKHAPQMSLSKNYTAQLSEIEAKFELPPIGESSEIHLALNLHDDSIYNPRNGAVVFFAGWDYPRIIGGSAQLFSSLSIKRNTEINCLDEAQFKAFIDSVVDEHYNKASVINSGKQRKPLEHLVSNNRKWIKYEMRTNVLSNVYVTALDENKYGVYRISTSEFMKDIETEAKAIADGHTIFESIEFVTP